MATQYTAGLSAGEVLTAATMNSIGAAWESYTPTWTASTTNPTLNNGTISGKYTQIQKLVIATGFLIPGSTTVFGAGTYRISLPLTAISTGGAMGYATFLDASAGFVAYNGIAFQQSTTTVEFRLGNAVGLFSPTVPVNPFAQSDQIRFTFVYEAA